MRIISKYRDYYDSALGYMQDPNLIYHRTCEERSITRWPFDDCIPRLLQSRPHWYGCRLQLAVVGFCGRIYPRWIRPDFVFTPENLTAAKGKSPVLSNLEAGQVWSDQEREGAEHLSRQAFEDRYGPNRLAADLEKRLAEVSLTKQLDVFIALKSACFVVTEERREGWWGKPTGYRIWTNPRLALLDMQRLFDPFTAFQEISMFLGNQLAQTDEAQRTTGDDRIIAQSKGFDDQSFRTASPGERKERRKLNRIRKAQGQ